MLLLSGIMEQYGLEDTIDIVDSTNGYVGQATRRDVHVKGLWHRCSHAFVQNDHSQLYLPIRDDVVCPGKYDISVAEHLRNGESFENGIKRGLKQRLEITAPHVRAISYVHPDIDIYDGGEVYGGSQITDRRFIQIFVAEHDGKINVDRRMYKEGGWFTVPEIERMVRNDPSQFTPYFLKDWGRSMPMLKSRSLL